MFWLILGITAVVEGYLCFYQLAYIRGFNRGVKAMCTKFAEFQGTERHELLLAV